jgi:methionine-rich copper-binding protein CopC
MNPRPLDGRRRVRLIGVVVALLLALPADVAAHSELVTADPPDGAVLTAPPAEVVLTFSDTLNPAKSSVTLHDAGGMQIATGGVDPADDKVMRLDPPALISGTYEIRWTSAASDGDILRGTLHFELAAPTPTPTTVPTATPTEAPSPSPTPSSEASASPAPAPSASPGPASGSGGDVLLPILAALVLVGILGATLLRGRSRGGGPA